VGGKVALRKHSVTVGGSMNMSKQEKRPRAVTQGNFTPIHSQKAPYLGVGGRNMRVMDVGPEVPTS